MKVLVALLFSALLITSTNAQAVAATAAGFGVTTGSSDSSVYPLTVTVTSSSASQFYYATSSSSIATSASSSGAPSAPTGTANVWTASWKPATGAPLTSTWTLTQQSGAGSAGPPSTVPANVGVEIQMAVGIQVAMTVTGTVTSGGVTNTGVTVGSLVANAAAVSPATAHCGDYYIDCAAGMLYFQLYVGTTQSAPCIVTITQVAAITGILAYTSANNPTQSNLQTAINNANTATSPSTSVCGTGASNSNVLYYYFSTYGTSTGTAQTTALNAVKSAASSGNLLNNVQSYTQNTPTSNTNGFTAPSSGTSNLANISKSQSRMMVVAGVLTTAFATIFGFAL